MSNYIKRFLSMAVALVMIIGMIPSTVFAAETPTTVSTEEALRAALTAGGSVTLEADIEVAAQIVIPGGVTATLDLNGYDINGGWENENDKKHIYVLSNKGTLTITDSSNNLVEPGSINSRGIYNYGALTLESGKIAAIDGNGGYAVYNQPGATFVMDGGWLAADNEDGDAPGSGYDATALNVPSGCTATLNGGKITNAGNFTFAIAAAGTLNIPATSTITVEGRHGAINVNGGITTVDAGTFSIPANTQYTDNVTYVAGGALIINGGTFTGDNDAPNAGSCVWDEIGGAVINGGTFGNSSGGDVWGTTGTTINGGTFENLTQTQHVTEGATIVNRGKTYTKTADVMVEVTAVAKVGDDVYATLQAAVEAADDGDTVYVVADHELTWDDTTMSAGETYAVYVLVEDKTLTIDLNGHALTVNTEAYTGSYEFGIIAAGDKGILTLTDSSEAKTGSLTATGTKAPVCLLWSRGGTSQMTIESGIYSLANATDSLVYAGNNEIVTVKGGTFTLGNVGTGVNGSPWIFNVAGQNERHVIVNGGTFNADINHQYYCFEVDVAETLALKDNGNGTWTVVDAVAYTGEVNPDGYTHEVGYATLQAAINAADAGETVTLVADVEEAVAVTSTLTLDLNGHTITGSDVDDVICINGGALTVKDSAGNGAIIADATVGYDVIAIFNEGALTVEGGNLSYNGTNAEGNIIYAHNGSVTITGGTLNATVNYPIVAHDTTVSISGGTFSFEPSADYIVYGYGVTANGNGTYTVAKIDPIAYIGTTPYYTLEEAIAAAEEGATITVKTSTHSGDLLINKAITLAAEDGATVQINGQLQIKADGVTVKGIQVESAGTAVALNAKNVLFENCKIVGSQGLYQAYTNGTVTFKNSTIVGTQYAINFAGNAGGKIVIEGCDVTGWVSFADSISQIVMTNSDFAKGNGNGMRFYNKNVTISGCTFDEGYTIDVAAEDATITVTDTDVTNGLFSADDVNTNNITVNGTQLVYAAKIGNVGYATLQAAIDAAADGDTITLIRDITESGIKLAGKSITLDLNGKVVSGTCTGTESSLIYVENDAALTVKDSSATGTGKLTFAAGSSNVGYTVDLKGALTLESGTIELTGTWDIGYAVDARPNSWSTEYTKPTVFTMNGGNIVSSDGGVRVASSSADTHKGVSASFVMNGGKIDAAWDGVFIQQSNAIYDVLSFTMNGGTIESDLNPIRVYGPAPTGYVNGQDCMDITLVDGTLSYTGTETREWIVDGILRVGGGSSADTIIENGTVTVSATFRSAVPDDYKWVEDGSGNYTLVAKVYVAAIGEVKYETFQAAIEAAEAANTEAIVIDLLGDVTLDVTAWETLAIGGAATETITINGNGNKLTFNHLNSDWNNVATVNGATLILNDMDITNSGHNDGPWNRHDINFACDVELNDVTSDKALAFKAGAVLNEVTINDPNTSDTYAIWIQPNGQSVTIANSTIDMLACSDGRGIKIDNQYLNGADKLVTLTVTDTVFKTEEKAAILVKTTAGAKITLSNVDISEVAADTVNAVWVDSASIAYNDLVVVTGGTKSQEDGVAQIGTTKYATLDDAFAAAADGDEVEILVAGTYALSTSGKNITITGAVAGVVFDNIGAKNMGGANVTFNNVTFDYYPNVNYTGLQHSGNLVYNNCTINGQVFLYGQSETFNECTFNQNSADAYNVWTYGAKEVAFNECTFNCVGKSVLIYAESASITNDVTVTDSTFKASAPVDGKAAIEMDSSLTAGIELNITNSTATGFANGNVSGNSLWNNKKGSNTDANNDITVVLDGTTVLAPVTFVAKIGTTKYATLQAAVKAAASNDIVTVIADHELTWDGTTMIAGETYAVYVLVENKTLTIDLNGHALTVDTDDYTGSYEFGIIAAGDKGTLTLKDSVGGGSLTATGGKAAILLWARGSSSRMTIESGSYFLETAAEGNGMIYAGNNEIVTVNGGTFTLGNVDTGANDSPWIFNVAGQNERHVIVKGGTFNADINHQYYCFEVDVAETLALKNNGNGTWTVVDAVAYTGEVHPDGYTHEVGYATLQEAIDAADAGETVTLVANVTEAVTVSKALTLDLNGHTITSATSTVAVTGGSLTVIDTSADADGAIITTGTGDEAIAVKNGAGLTLEKGNIQGVKYAIYVYGSGGNVVINGGAVKATYADVYASYAVYVGAGSVTVTGGSFTGGVYVIYAYTGATATLQGGTYTTLPNTAYIAAGYDYKVNDDSTYTVYKRADNAIMIGETAYTTLAAALAKVQAGQTITINEAGHYAWGSVALPDGVTIKATVDGVTVKADGDNVINATTLTVENIDFVAGYRAAYVTNGEATELNFIDCSFTGVYAFHVDACAEGATFTFTDCVFNGFTTFCSTVDNIAITGGELNGTLALRQDAQISDVALGEDALIAVRDEEVAENVTVTVDDCTAADGVANHIDATENVVIVDGEILYGAQAELNGVKYVSLQDAIDAAASGDTVKMLTDVDVEELTVRSGRTLDLNGFTLNVDYLAAFRGSNIIDSSEENTGLLDVANKEDVALPATNAQLPVWNGTGYIFVEILNFQEMKTNNADGSLSYVFLPTFETVAHTYLAQGNAFSDVKIAVRLSWKVGTADVSQNFIYNDECVKDVVDSYDNGRYGLAYTALLKNLDAEDVEVSVVLISGTGVEVTLPKS